ncbi:MAG: transglycosylase SLT domain-containing protein [Polyangiaceae bacterium]|nr:transglycosylase SLT domain-containing protein [Polyangiaceae bacterium]
MRKAVAIGLCGGLTLVASACADRSARSLPSSVDARAPEVAPAASVATVPATSVSAALSASASLPPAQETTRAEWMEAIRIERWDEAQTLLDALPESERNRPDIRYVRGRVAFERGDAAKAVEYFTGLDKDLPILADDIVRRRAEAASIAGPYAEAAAFFRTSSHPSDLYRAVISLEKAGQLAEAKVIADRAIAAASKGKAKAKRDEARLRAARARITEAMGAASAAIADFRALAIDAAGQPEGDVGIAALSRLGKPLGPKEKLERAKALIRVGKGHAAVAILDELDKEKTVKALDVQQARAELRLRARDYAGAEKAYRALSAVPGAHKPEALYQAATALARGGNADAAIKRWLDVSARYKKNPWAERALFQAARYTLLRGRYAEAAPLYTRYLAMFPKGVFRSDAEYDQALSLLSSTQPAIARKKLADMAARERKPDEAQRLHELEGVAAFRAGDRDGAVRIWTDVARAFPLSFGALAARGRLGAVGAPVPALIERSTPRLPEPLTVELPDVPRFLVSLGLDADAEPRLLAFEKDASARFAGREGEALCGLYGKLAHARRRYRVGIAQVGLSQLMRAPSDADRWAWECLYPRPYSEEVTKLEATHGVPSGLVHALMRQESAFDQEALSPVHAVGLMQLMPGTAEKAAAELQREFDGSKLKSPHVNLLLGTYYIGKLIGMFQKNHVLAVASYNAGPKAVGQWIKRGVDADVDLWVARIPYDETRNYVARVMGNLARYQWLSGGDDAVTPLPLEVPLGVEVPADAY